jgi:hypothetical protein
MLGVILIAILVLALLGVSPVWSYSLAGIGGMPRLAESV